MSTRPYVVRQGDYLTKLAHDLGFDADAVWNDDDNRALRDRRPNPDILQPGDVLHMPAPEPATGPQVSANTSNKYRARVPTVEVKLKLRDAADGPLASKAYRVLGMGAPLEGTTDGEGLATFSVPVRLREVCLVLEESGQEYQLLIGDMDPITEPSGVRKRLEHLGYLSRRDGEGTDDERLRDAIFGVSARARGRRRGQHGSGDPGRARSGARLVTGDAGMASDGEEHPPDQRGARIPVAVAPAGSRNAQTTVLGSGADVILVSRITANGDDFAWARQFCRLEPWTQREPRDTTGGGSARRVLMEVPGGVSRSGMVDLVGRAARAAGRGGRVLFLVGHRYGAAGIGVGAIGAVDLAPSNFRLTQDAHPSRAAPIYSFPGGTGTLPATPDALDMQSHYRRMGDHLARAGVGMAGLLACGVGANRGFMMLIHDDWHVPVAGYADGLASIRDTDAHRLVGGRARGCSCGGTA